MRTGKQTQTEPVFSRVHVNSLDGVRGIAILLVLAVHLRNMELLPRDHLLVNLLTALMSLGWAGVDLFFVLSGFLITGVLLDTKPALNRAKAFFGCRAVRIFPLYYAVLGATVLVARVFPPPSWKAFDIWPSLLGWVSYFCYFQNWWMPLKEPQHLAVVSHLWSLAVEEQFYLIWPWCVWLLPQRRLPLVCALGFLAAFLARWACLEFAAAQTPWFTYMSTITRMDTLLVGDFCAVAIRDKGLLSKTRGALPWIAATASAAFCSTVWFFSEIWHSGYYTKLYGYSLLAVLAGCGVLSAALHEKGTGW